MLNGGEMEEEIAEATTTGEGRMSKKAMTFVDAGVLVTAARGAGAKARSW